MFLFAYTSLTLIYKKKKDGRLNGNNYRISIKIIHGKTTALKALNELCFS